MADSFASFSEIITGWLPCRSMMAATFSADTTCTWRPSGWRRGAMPVGVWYRPAAQACLANVLEEVFVYPLNDIGLLVLDADVVLDHQLCKHAAVDQNHPGGNTLSVCGGFWREAAGRDEDATARLGALKGTDKRLDLGP